MLNVLNHSQPSMSNMLSLPNSQEANDLLNQTTIIKDSQKVPSLKSFTQHKYFKTTH